MQDQQLSRLGHTNGWTTLDITKRKPENNWKLRWQGAQYPDPARLLPTKWWAPLLQQNKHAHLLTSAWTRQRLGSVGVTLRLASEFDKQPLTAKKFSIRSFDLVSCTICHRQDSTKLEKFLSPLIPSVTQFFYKALVNTISINVTPEWGLEKANTLWVKYKAGKRNNSMTHDQLTFIGIDSVLKR